MFYSQCSGLSSEKKIGTNGQVSIAQSKLLKYMYPKIWEYSSVVEHSTADREVPSSNLGAPFNFINDIMFFKSIFPCIIASYTRGLVAQWIAHLTSDQKVAGSSPVWVDC